MIVSERVGIEEMLEKQIDTLFKCFCQIENIQEYCLLNKELCRTVEVLIKLDALLKIGV